MNDSLLSPDAAGDAPPRSPRPTIFAGEPTSVRSVGYDEIWLHTWLTEEPQRLGLGDVEVLERELSQAGGGSLDILARQGELTSVSRSN